MPKPIKQGRYRPAKASSGGGLLALSWAVVVLLIGGVIGWLLVAEERAPIEARTVSPRVIVQLPPPLSPEIAVPESVPEAPPPAPPAPVEKPAPDAPPPPVEQAVVPAPIAPVAPAAPAAPAVRQALPPAPDPQLVEESQKGPLPAIASDGREPWQAYARPFDPTDRRPRIALVINWLGLSDAATEAAIQELPGTVTLAFAPYAENLTHWVQLARAAGHEVLLNLPMEPLNYPANDPGPQALLTSLSPARNLDRLEWTLARVTGYVGVTNYMGSRFTTSATALKPVLTALKSRGLLFLDSRSSSNSLVPQVAQELALPWVANNRFLDNQASRAAIDRELAALETLARRHGYAVGIGFPYPVTLERLSAWIGTLDKKGFVLVPVSAIPQTKKPE